MRGEYADSGGPGEPGLVELSMIIGESLFGLAEYEGAGRFIPAIDFVGERELHPSPK